MRWRAVRKAGAEAPALAAEAGDYVPEPTGSKNSVILVSQYSGKEYRVDLMDPLNVGAPIKLLRKRDANFYIEDGTLWGDMFSGGASDPSFGSPPFRGSQNKLGSEMNPPVSPTNEYIWQKSGAKPPVGMTAAEVTAELWTRNFDDNVSGGTNLWDIAFREIRQIIANRNIQVGGGTGIIFRFNTIDSKTYIAIDMSTVSEDPYNPVLPSTYYKGGPSIKYWTEAGISDPACWGGVGARLSVRIGLEPEVSYPGVGPYYAPGVSGYVRYPKPRIYLMRFPDESIRLVTYVENNYRTHINYPNQWPYVSRWGLNGIHLLPGIPSDSANFQYRFPGWAQFRR